LNIALAPWLWLAFLGCGWLVFYVSNLSPYFGFVKCFDKYFLDFCIPLLVRLLAEPSAKVIGVANKKYSDHQKYFLFSA